MDESVCLVNDNDSKNFKKDYDIDV
jgi:hypothetical protein